MVTMFFFLNSPFEGTVSSIEQKIRDFYHTDVQEFHLRREMFVIAVGGVSGIQIKR
jgi:hypothetical protein